MVKAKAPRANMIEVSPTSTVRARAEAIGRPMECYLPRAWRSSFLADSTSRSVWLQSKMARILSP